MNATKTILCQENPISLCSAFVLDDGYVVSFGLSDRDHGKWKGTYLYRRRRTLLARMTLTPLGEHQEKVFRFSSSHRIFWGWVGHFAYRRFLVALEKDIKVMQFSHQPKMELLGSDPGDSVALLLEGQPWAFIHRDKNHGYSKGVLRAGFGNIWDEDLFEQTFGNT